MIKRILVALDPDTDTPIATRYAIDIARRYDAEVTGLAVVDTGSIDSDVRGGGIGSFYYVEKLRENLTAETRTRALALIRSFEQTLKQSSEDGSSVRYSESVQEGVPFQRIIEDMKVYDMLVMGRDPHFFYGHPSKKTNTVARVVNDTVGPTLIVGNTHRDIRRVLIACDGSSASARAIRRFVHMKPFGIELDVQLLCVFEKDSGNCDLVLRLTREYLEAHGFSPAILTRTGTHPENEILKFADEAEVDLIVAGAHAKSRIRRIAFGSTTAALLKRCTLPLFIDN